MKLSRFEDIGVWKFSRKFVQNIYKITDNERFKRDFALRDQIRRASISVMSNISEGFERQSNSEFIRFLFIAKASAGEARSQLYVALDLKYIEQKEFDVLYKDIEEISKSLSGFIKYLKTSK